MFAKTTIFFGGSDASNAMVNGVKVSYSTPNDLGAISYSDTKSFQLQLNDVNNNPMPSGTKVEITAATNGSATVTPATVPSIAPHGANGVDDKTGAVTGTQGSVHIVSVSGTAATPCVPKTANFNVTTTTPSGSVTNIPFKLSFTCP